MRQWIGICLGTLVLLMGCTGLIEPPNSSTGPLARSPHLLLGNPSRAIANPNSPDNYLMEKRQYALSYNRSKGIANWVSWQLTADWLGNVPRRNDFRPDATLPQGWYQVKPTDYNGSGFDRGHMTPSKDRTDTEPDNSATFLMTNILPQSPDNNQGPWERLESYCRDLVAQGKTLYIIAGGYGQRKTLANGKISVPARIWKVVVVMNQREPQIDQITTANRVIAVDLPNRQGIREMAWTEFRVSVDQIEQVTGYDLLADLPDPIEQFLERQVDRL